jgi:hypothetical protein
MQHTMCDVNNLGFPEFYLFAINGGEKQITYFKTGVHIGNYFLVRFCHKPNSTVLICCMIFNKLILCTYSKNKLVIFILKQKN